jgi:predicted ATPase with chaperone activity
MLAERLPGPLPDLAGNEVMEVTAVHLLCALPSASGQLLRRPPVEDPHQSTTAAGDNQRRLWAAPAKCRNPRPAHGVLFLDQASNLGHHAVKETDVLRPGRQRPKNYRERPCYVPQGKLAG